MADDRILDRVRKLLAKAEHPSTPPAEAEAMSEKAAELMARHALDLALLEVRDSAPTKPRTRTIKVPAPYAVPKSILLCRVSAAYRVRAVIAGARENTGRVCTLVGFPADLEVVEILFTSLLLQGTSAMLTAQPAGPRVRAFRHAFLIGYAETIGRRLDAAQRRIVAEVASSAERSTALVLADREREVERTFAEMFPRLGRLRTSASSGYGVHAGRQAGLGADLSTGRSSVGGPRRALGAS